MRKVKLTVICKLPSWNFCNYDGTTKDMRPSKELCRFCSHDRNGYRCLLHDVPLGTDPTFVRKTDACIKATAGFAITADEQDGPTIDPRDLMAETINQYQTTVNSLQSQGYPKAIAESTAKKYVLGDN